MGVPVGAWLFLSIIVLTYSFNIDVDFPILKESTNEDGYFGYSVAQHSIQESSSVYPVILVGSPLATSDNTILSSHKQTGALYRCAIDLKNPAITSDCMELAYPDTSQLYSDMNIDADAAVENKTDMWLGVNIRSGGAGKDVVACGHRYKVLETDVNVYGVGICYNYDPSLALKAKSPYTSPCVGESLVDTVYKSVSLEYGVCQAGMGLDAKESDVIYGLPGVKAWQGAALWQGNRPWPHEFSELLEIPEAQAITGYYSYMGSSVVMSRNLLGGRTPVVILGAPREGDNGTVIIFERSEIEKQLMEKQRIVSDQFGSNYGHSAAVVDIKGDNHPSLIVGAPFYHNMSDANSGTMVGGAIYVYYNYGDGIMVDSQVIIGPGKCNLEKEEDCINAQFGYSVIGVGDINQDGFHDLAVGAPYYGSGAVFIYSGQADAESRSLSFQLSQVIMASDLETSGYLTRDIDGFGVSLSGGHDMDGQGYTDILVGAHTSSHVVVLRSRPVATITAAIKLNSTQLDPKSKTCLSEPGSPYMCIDFVTCFTATYPDKRAPEDITVSYNLTADSGYDFTTNRRVVFNAGSELDSVKQSTANIRIDGVEKCEIQKVYVKYVRELLKPIEFKISYELISAEGIPYDNINKYPIMNIFTPADPGAKIDFERDCITPTCDTDLAVSAIFTDRENVLPVRDELGNTEFVFDSNRVKKLDLTIRVKVDSKQDRAYEPHVYVFLEDGLRYTGTADIKDQATSCSGNPETNLVVCSFGRTLPKGENRTIILTLDYKNLGATFSTINVTANTTSRDTTQANNFATLKVKVNVVTDLELLGSATKGLRVKYGDGEIKGASAIQFDSEIGDLVQHTYTIINNGDHGVVSKVTVVISWPYEIASSGEYLLYMLGFPRIVDVAHGKGQCHIQPGFINPQKYQLTEEDTISLDDVESARRKREAVDKKTAAVRGKEEEDGSSKRFASLNCIDGTANCFNITCEFVDVKPGEQFKIRLDSRVWNSSLTKDFGNTVDYVEIVSNAFLFIDPGALVSQPNTDNDRTNITTEAEPDISLKPKAPKIEIWIIIVAAVVGLVLLIVIILVFWKCGFFKRNRPMTHSVKVEKQGKQSKTQYAVVPQNDHEQLT